MPTKSIPPVAPVTSHREPRTRIRVLVVDDHPAVRVGARNLIDDQPDMEVVAEARSAEEVLLQSNHQVDVAVVDYQLGAGDDGLRLTAQLKQLERPPAVLVYSAFADSALAVLALVAGADGLLEQTRAGRRAVLCHPQARPRPASPARDQLVGGAGAAFARGTARPGDFRDAGARHLAGNDRRTAGDHVGRAQCPSRHHPGIPQNWPKRLHGPVGKQGASRLRAPTTASQAAGQGH